LTSQSGGAEFGAISESKGDAFRAVETIRGRGTGGYRAPELLWPDESTYTNKVDIWAMACILYEIADLKKLYVDDLATYMAVVKKKRLFPKSLKTKFIDPKTEKRIIPLLSQMFRLDADSRPSASSLLAQFEENLGGIYNHCVAEQKCVPSI
jgi:serine/threonine protein kinase